MIMLITLITILKYNVFKLRYDVTSKLKTSRDINHATSKFWAITRVCFAVVLMLVVLTLVDDGDSWTLVIFHFILIGTN